MEWMKPNRLYFSDEKEERDPLSPSPLTAKVKCKNVNVWGALFTLSLYHYGFPGNRVIKFLFIQTKQKKSI